MQQTPKNLNLYSCQLTAETVSYPPPMHDIFKFRDVSKLFWLTDVVTGRSRI